MKRRAALAGAAAAAGAAGVAAAMWQARRAGGSAADELRSLRIPRAGGDGNAAVSENGGPESGGRGHGEHFLDFARWRGSRLLVNFWATWCPPCIVELPLLDRFDRANRHLGWRVIGLAVDTPEAVASFLAAHPVSFELGVIGMAGIGLTKRLGNAGGSLPFSVVTASNGTIAHTRPGVWTSAALSTLTGQTTR